MALHDSTVKIPEKLLSNFNPYDILEPQKCNTVPAVDKLIDIGDFPLHKDVNASLLDQKTDYDLVDLFENMYVTAGHVKLKNNDIIGIDINDSDSTSSGFDSGANISSGADSSSTISNGFDRSDSGSSYDDEAFKQFCDKIESGEKIDWTKEVRPQKEYDASKPRDLTPKLVKEDVLDPEDLIYEVLSEKTKEKRILDEISSAATVNAPNKNCETIALEIPKLKVLNSPKIEIKAPEKKIEQFASSSSIKSNTDFAEVSSANSKVHNVPNLKVLNGPKIETRTSEKNVGGACCQTCKLSKSFINKTEIDIMSEISRLKLNNNLFYNKNVYKNTPCAFNLNVTKADFKVIAVKKNEKEYKKTFNAKPEKFTKNYSEGADFDEKSIVLPQIMARINARKTYLIEKSLLKRRLVLDGGKTPSNANEIKKNTNDKDGGSSVTNFETNSSTSKGINKCCTCAHIIKSPNTEINFTKKDVNENFGEVNPTVLMEDCNKERLKALKKSQMFKAFVHGK